MFLPYAVEDNIERKQNELNVDLNESLNTINKRNVNKVSSVGIIVFALFLLLIIIIIITIIIIILYYRNQARNN
jgi:lipopolysaccharide/colanic/teichoic acid biosynthesis glycosyltransferase